MKKFLIGFFLAFSIFLIPNSVSAASFTAVSSAPLVDFYNPLSLPSSDLRDIEDAVYSNLSVINAQLDDSNSFIAVYYDSGTYYLFICRSDSFVQSGDYFVPRSYASTSFHDISSLSSYNFSFQSLYWSAQDPYVFYYNFPVITSSGSCIYADTIHFSGNGWGTDVFFAFNDARSFTYFYNYNFPTEIDYSTGLPYLLGIDVPSFYQWCVDNNKISLFPSYLVSNKIQSYLDFYNQFGSSNFSFISLFNNWLAQNNIMVQAESVIKNLKSFTDNLYREYLNSINNHSYWPGAAHLQTRYDIDTQTDNNNLTLVTDDSNDTLDISILRDILRGVIAISNNINAFSDRVYGLIKSLDLSVSISNGGGISSDLSPVLNKMDEIINSFGSDTVSVEIDQNIKDDTDDFFDDWNLEFSTALNNKFPVASQLNQFFTGFFERCGIDADSDGEVYQYYNPGVLTASSVSRSSGSASEEDIVSDFLGQFDNSDPSFLDDASFHGVPDLSVSVGGHSISIIDFRVYAKYRDKIHFIISFVIWTLYLLHLYKALPQIIGQVADVATKTSEL